MVGYVREEKSRTRGGCVVEEEEGDGDGGLVGSGEEEGCGSHGCLRAAAMRAGGGEGGGCVEGDSCGAGGVSYGGGDVGFGGARACGRGEGCVGEFGEGVQWLVEVER